MATSPLTPLRSSDKDNPTSTVDRTIPGSDTTIPTHNELLRSEELLRALWENAADAMALSDPQGTVIAANTAYYQLYGLTPHQVIGQHFAIIFPPEARPQAAEQYLHVFNGQAQPGTFEVEVQRSDGTWRVVESRADFVTRDGHRVAMLSVIRDVTTHKRAEEVLRRQAALIDLSPDGIFVRRLNGTITFWSQGAETLYGWTRQEALGRLTQDLLRTRYPQPLNEIVRHLRQSGQWTGELVHCAKNGREIIVQSFWQAQFDDNGKVTELMESNVDITERKHLLEAQMAARREAERQNELRVRFLGMVSHELRTPLQSIKGFATTLLADDVAFAPAEQRDFLRTIDTEADKLTDMIDQLLDLSRLEAGTLTIDPQVQTLNAILLAAKSQLDMLATQHPLVIRIEGALPYVRADRQRIAQVLTNLVSNAAKYAPPKTPIGLSAERTDEWVQVSVRDQGPGIAPEDRKDVFEAFRRGRDNHTRQTKGAGLGLAICKGIVEAHGGRIWISDNAPHGTIISFTLPTAPTTPP